MWTSFRKHCPAYYRNIVSQHITGTKNVFCCQNYNYRQVEISCQNLKIKWELNLNNPNYFIKGTRNYGSGIVIFIAQAQLALYLFLLVNTKIVSTMFL